MVTDFHTHIFPSWSPRQRQRYLERDVTFSDLYSTPNAKSATADNLIHAMDEDGVDRSVVMGIGWTDIGLAREVNDYIIDSMRRYPKRLVGFAGVNPAWGRNAVIEADRCASAGLLGIGELHPDSQSFNLGDEKTMGPLVEVIREHNLIVTTHSSEPVGHLYRGKGATKPEVLWRFVQNFPDINVVCAHWGGGLPFYTLLPEVAEGLTNVFFDTAASPLLYTNRVFRLVTELVGASKILLASDFPLVRARNIIRQLDESGLSEKDKTAIINDNATALLNR